MDYEQVRQALKEPIKTDPPWMRGLGWRNTLIINDWEIDVIIERLKAIHVNTLGGSHE